MSEVLKKLYFEPTSECNLNCEMCFRHTWVDETPGDMRWETFEKALMSMPETVETVFFGGMGEPLFHPRILDMVRAAAQTGRRVELLTNGTLLNEAAAEGLLTAGLNALWVSMDTFDTAGVGGHGDFALVKENIETFNRCRERLGSKTALSLAFVVMQSNVLELPALARFAYEHQVAEVSVSNVIPSDAETERDTLYAKMMAFEAAEYSRQQHYPMIRLPLMDWVLPVVQNSLIGLGGESIQNYCNIAVGGAPALRRDRYCRFVEEGMCFVRSDGSVCPCMGMLHSAQTVLFGQPRLNLHHSFGNAALTPLGEIWTGAEYAAFRGRVRDFVFSPCTRCGGCENRLKNQEDCMGNTAPTCGGCLWSEGLFFCP